MKRSMLLKTPKRIITYEMVLKIYKSERFEARVTFPLENVRTKEYYRQKPIKKLHLISR